MEGRGPAVLTRFAGCEAGTFGIFLLHVRYFFPAKFHMRITFTLAAKIGEVAI
jgi:hypothetical protein